MIGYRNDKLIKASTTSFIYEIPFGEVKFSKEHDRLGSGSFGDVYEGIWRDRRVAVKVFRRQRESFKNELEQLSEIRHPNIVRLYGSSQSPNSSEAYLIMELANCPLNDLLHETPLREYGLKHACSWALQAAAGMSYCHDLRPKALIHRDIKPANLLLFEDGKVLKICDFGTAVSQRSTMTNNTGTVCYMAPEVFKDVHYDARCDVFSWSIMFWEILARKKPYYDRMGYTIYKLQSDILQKRLRPNPMRSCPKLIWDLLEKSWDGEPHNRPHMRVVVREMVTICIIAGIKSGRSSVTNSDCNNKITHQAGDHSLAPSSVSIRSSYQCPTIDVSTTTVSKNDDLLAEKKMFNHMRAMRFRLKLANDRRKFLEEEASKPIKREALDQIDELKDLHIVMNSLNNLLNHLAGS